MNDARRARLERLTRRWRSRHDAARTAERPPADAERETRAHTLFPFREMAAADYVDRYGSAMSGFTYDEYTYGDPELDAWLVELGKLLQARRG
ncbi:MAG: hypothetical protein M3R05_00425 [Chloroflexota bacterium]|nr:hypothetical protein [Chloroflexota bacterium]